MNKLLATVVLSALATLSQAHSLEPGLMDVRGINGYTKFRMTAVNHFTTPKTFRIDFFEDNLQDVPITEGIRVSPQQFNVNPQGRKNILISARTGLDKIYVCSTTVPSVKEPSSMETRICARVDIHQLKRNSQ
jgi:hypothetical protein